MDFVTEKRWLLKGLSPSIEGDYEWEVAVFDSQELADQYRKRCQEEFDSIENKSVNRSIRAVPARFFDNNCPLGGRNVIYVIREVRYLRHLI